MADIEINPFISVTQIADGPLLRDPSWYPVLAATRRGGDGEIVLQITEWRGGVGAQPATGFIGPHGLVPDANHALALEVASGSAADADARIRLLVKPFALNGGDPVGTDDLSTGVVNTLRDSLTRAEVSADGEYLQFASGAGITQFEIATQLVPPTVSQADAEAGTSENVRSWTARRVAQAIAALTPSGGGNGGTAPTTVSQTEAETGTATTVRSWTAQRVRQAINAVVRSPARLQSNDRWTAAQLPQDVVYTGDLPAAPAEVTEAQARAGTLTTVRRWSPLRVAQAIASLAPKVPSTVSQAVAEAGTSTAVRSWTAQRVAQAIAALAPSGGGSGTATEIDPVALPSADGKEVGTRAISETDDRWKVVVDSSDAPNVMRFTLGDFGNGYLGVSAGVTGRPAVGSFEDAGIVGEIQLRTTASGTLPIWVIYRLKSLSGNVALANLFGQGVVVRGATKGNVVDIATAHSAANDVTNSFQYRSGADDAELDTPAVGDVLQISFYNNATRTLPATMHGTVERWEDEEDHTAGAQVKSDWNATSGDAEILNKPAIHNADPAFREGVLDNSDTDHVQEILNAFISPGWTNAAGAGDLGTTHPYVALQTSATQYTSANVAAGTWGQLYTQGSTALENRYQRVRIPLVYGEPLKLLRLAIDSMGTVLNDDDVSLILTGTTYRYYSAGPLNIPAGSDRRVQHFDDFEIDSDRVSNVPPETGTDGQQLERVAGKPAWVDKPHRVGRTLFTSSQTINFALGTGRSIRSASPDYFPDFDLLAAENQTGVYHILVGLRLGGSGLTDVNMGFIEGGANQSDADRRRELIGEATATRLRGTPVFVFSSTGALEGLEVITQNVWSGATNVGTYIGLLARRDTPNMRAGYYGYWVGRSGSTTPLMFEDVSVIWVPNDAAFAPTSAANQLETLLDYTPGTADAIANANVFTELPAAAAFSRALTADDDDRMLTIEYVVGQGADAVTNRYPWSAPLCVNAGDWRAASQTADNATPNNIEGWFNGTQLAGRNVDAWQRMIVAKGANDRVGFSSQRGTTGVYRVRVRLLP